MGFSFGSFLSLFPFGLLCVFFSHVLCCIFFLYSPLWWCWDSITIEVCGSRVVCSVCCCGSVPVCWVLCVCETVCITGGYNGVTSVSPVERWLLEALWAIFFNMG